MSAVSQDNQASKDLGSISQLHTALQAALTGPAVGAKVVSAESRAVASGEVRLAVELGDLVLYVHRDQLLKIVSALRESSQLAFNMLLSVTAIDWLDQRDERYELVYHLLSLSSTHRLRIKTALPEGKAEIDSLVPLYKSANFMERETWDMYGISFRGHPDQRRILMYDEFEGHPLRKDYPVQGKQPRIPLIHPEVNNTARNMLRPELVSINSRRER